MRVKYNAVFPKFARIARTLFLLALAALIFMMSVTGEIRGAVAGFAVMLLLFFNSFYLSLSVPEAQTRGAEILRSLRAGLHYFFCYLAVPASVLALSIESERHEAFPFAVDALIGVGVFLFCLPMAFLLREKKSGVKLLGYLAMMMLVLIAIPQYVVLRGETVGKLMARRAWTELVRGEKASATLSRFSLTVIGKTEAFASFSEPLALMFISVQKERPFCVGLPQSAERTCQETLEQLSRAHTDDTDNMDNPAATERTGQAKDKVLPDSRPVTSDP
jgi:hypothetical protein